MKISSNFPENHTKNLKTFEILSKTPQKLRVFEKILKIFINICGSGGEG
jgi:hypothetical protein